MEPTTPSRAQSIGTASVWFLCGAAVLCVPVGIWSGASGISGGLGYLPFGLAGGVGFVWARGRLSSAARDKQYNVLDLVGLGVVYFSAAGILCLHGTLIIVLVALKVLLGSGVILGSPSNVWEFMMTAPIIALPVIPAVLLLTIILGAVAGLIARLGQRPGPSR